MYFWKIEDLKRDIKEKQLTEKDRFIYALIFVVFSAIGMELVALMPMENGNIWYILFSVSSVLIVALGTVFVFKANGGSAGTDFLGKYFSISFVVNIRFLVILIPMFIGLMLYYFYVFPENEEMSNTFLGTVPFIIWHAAIYWRVFNHIRDVKNS